MGKGFLSRISRIFAQSGIILEILDARFPELTRNRELERKALASKKKLLLVLNKSDLVSRKLMEKKKSSLEKEFQSVFVSAKKKTGIFRLKNLILAMGGGSEKTIALIGYPNTGKSSLINCLVGKKVAGTSAKPGFTRGEKLVRMAKNVLVFDSPGTIPFNEKDEFLLALANAKNSEQLKDPEGAGLDLIGFLLRQKPDYFEEKFGLKEKDSQKILEGVAEKKGFLLSKGKPDSVQAAKFLIKNWQTGKIKI